MSQKINQKTDWEPNANLATMPTVASKEYCHGMRHFAAGVTIITSRHEQKQAGLTATALCSVTADPPRLVVFVNKDVATSQVIIDSGALCVNILASDQEDIAKAFACMIEGVHGEDRFKYGDWDKLLTGSPVLKNASACFDCRVIKIYDESTHNAFLCEVLATSKQDDNASALIYFNSGFQHISQ